MGAIVAAFLALCIAAGAAIMWLGVRLTHSVAVATRRATPSMVSVLCVVIGYSIAFLAALALLLYFIEGDAAVRSVFASFTKNRAEIRE